MAKPQTVVLTQRALFQRVARRLARDGDRLLTCREDSRSFRDLGRYYSVDATNYLNRINIDLPALATKLEVLQPWERVDA